MSGVGKRAQRYADAVARLAEDHQAWWLAMREVYGGTRAGSPQAADLNGETRKRLDELWQNRETARLNVVALREADDPRHAT